MKKIILSIFSLLALAACVKEELPQPIEPQQEGDMVTLTFDVKVPEAGSATRVMGDEKINSLHLIVFDEQGYFTYKAPAKLAAVADDEFPNDPTKRQFSVELPNSSAKRIIHFVANISGQYNNIEAGHEDGVMSSLYVDDNADAYWQRMEYNGGIANDASTADFASGAIIPLVRNYAKIKVQAAQNSGFTLKGFKVFNTYSQGSIAAYDGEFVEFVEMNTATDSESRMFTPKTYDEMGDYGCNEMGSLGTDGIGSYASTADVYVRETPSDAKPYIIIFGTYSGKDCYYKLEFDGKHIYRNFEYTFNIKSVTKAGHTEEGDAKSSTAEGSGLSYDKSTANLLNLSDGKSQLYVSAMTIVMVDNTRTYELKYKYVPDINNGAVDNTKASVDWTSEGNKVISNLVYTAATTDSEGYTTITITPATTMPSSAQRTEIEISDGKNLVRNVNVYLMPPYQMTVNAYDGVDNDNKVPEALNQKVWVDVAIPTDVQPALFPLEFVFETAAQSLYPDASSANTMPVRTGTSIIPNKTETTFGFVYTLTWEEYVDLKNNADEGASTVTFTAKFLTNKAASASQVYVYNEYFATGNDDFTNGGDPHYWTGTLEFEVVGGDGFGNNIRTFDIYSDSSRQTKIGSVEDLSSGETRTVELQITTGYKLTESSSIYFYNEYESGWGWNSTTYVCNQSETISALIGGKDVILNFTQNQ